MNRLESLRPITRRALWINYQSPQICPPEEQASGSGGAACSEIEIYPIQQGAGPELALTSLESTIYLSWSAVPNGFLYLIYRSDSLDGVYTLVDQTTDLFFNDNPGNSDIYYYRVTAIEPNYGETTPSNVVFGSAGATSSIRITGDNEFRAVDSGELRRV